MPVSPSVGVAGEVGDALYSSAATGLEELSVPPHPDASRPAMTAPAHSSFFILGLQGNRRAPRPRRHAATIERRSDTDRGDMTLPGLGPCLVQSPSWPGREAEQESVG